MNILIYHLLDKDYRMILTAALAGWFIARFTSMGVVVEAYPKLYVGYLDLFKLE